MSAASLTELWEASAGQPFQPTIAKGTQFTVGFTLLLLAFILTSLFGLNAVLAAGRAALIDATDNSLKNVPLYGIPASLAFGYASLLIPKTPYTSSAEEA
ncbi:hypothetical protein D0864_00747 [Hortaea werneckii]|uniref:Dolichyl-diphosphooligosaccharide-protein glycosyltransferase subunit OST5 n=1 Tax=Hortaea werneckii TaxID=91943 RepID=A0A3M7HGM5_HORWE|nr:hypothetical protein D0864_00747 [Hortaea werneckii]